MDTSPDFDRLPSQGGSFVRDADTGEPMPAGAERDMNESPEQPAQQPE